MTGIRDNWWVGLSLLHTLFTLEHNLICDRLHAIYPAWSDDALYRTARLINAALLAKIHTIEWTPAILNNPVLHIGMNVNWFGLEKLGYHFLINLIHDKVVAEGILGSQTNYHGVDYSLSEEFVSVYRLHPLIPDEVSFSSIKDGSLIEKRPMLDLDKDNARMKIQDHISMTDLFYSFGIEHPGAISLH